MLVSARAHEVRKQHSRMGNFACHEPDRDAGITFYFLLGQKTHRSMHVEAAAATAVCRSGPSCPTPGPSIAARFCTAGSHLSRRR